MNIMETDTQEKEVKGRLGAKPPRITLLHRMIRNWATIAVVSLVVVVVMLAGMIRSEGKALEMRKKNDPGTIRPATNVVALTVTPDHLQERIKLPGFVKPWLTLNVVAEVPGKIVEKKVGEGSRVQKGDVLATIDDRDYRNAYASAKASYEVATASEKRLQALFKDRVATQAQIDDILASVRTSKAAMDNAALALSRCTIRAPMAGIVNQIHVDPGKYMDVGKPVAQLLDIDRVKVEVGIPESDVDEVRRLEAFSITLDALGGKVFQGRRHYLYKTTDNFARLYNLEIAVDNPQHEILPDMFARVNIVKTDVPDGLAVPLYALVKKNEMDAVFVVADNVAQLRPVTLGIQDGWRMQVTKGLSDGDHVVVMGQRSIDNGDPVAVTRTVRSMEELTR